MKHFAGIVLLLLLSPVSFAQGSGTPETVLAGINIEQAKIGDVIQLYGQPEAVYAVPDPYPVGSRQYRWGRLTLTLKVLTEPSPAGEKITAIQIDGDGANNAMSSTGRGLKLGDKQAAIRKIYGVEPRGSDIRVDWKTISLLIHVQKSRVARLELLLRSASAGP